jgi:hypothetical protein
METGIYKPKWGSVEDRTLTLSYALPVLMSCLMDWCKASPRNLFALVLADRLDAEPVCDSNQMGQRFSMQFIHHLPPMRLNSTFRRAELIGDLFVQQSGRDQCEDLSLARGEQPIFPLQPR